MRYDVRKRTLTLERHDCRRCRKGKVPNEKRCPVCWGTGSGPRGGKGGCHNCNGYGTVFDRDDLIACQHCGGDYEGADAERWTDHVPPLAMELIPIWIEHTDRPNSWNENYLGMGSLYSCQDYGKASMMSDDDIRAMIRADVVARPPQATKVTGDIGSQRRKLATNLRVTVTRDGFNVKAEGLVTRPKTPTPEPVEHRALRPIGEAPKDVCPTCHLVHIPGECF